MSVCWTWPRRWEVGDAPAPAERLAFVGIGTAKKGSLGVSTDGSEAVGFWRGFGRRAGDSSLPSPKSHKMVPRPVSEPCLCFECIVGDLTL